MTLQELFPELPPQLLQEHIELTSNNERFIKLDTMSKLLSTTRRTLTNYIRILRPLVRYVKEINGIRFAPSTVYILAYAIKFRTNGVSVNNLYICLNHRLKVDALRPELNRLDGVIPKVEPILKPTHLMSFVYKKRSWWNPLGWLFWALKL